MVRENHRFFRFVALISKGFTIYISLYHNPNAHTDNELKLIIKLNTMADSKIFMFDQPRGGYGYGNGIDPGLLALMNNNGGFGGNNAWWLIFLWMMWANGNGNGWGNNNGTGFLSNQINNDRGNDLVLQAINGRADALGQLVQITHSNVESVRNVLATMQASIQDVTAQVGMSSLQLQNAVQAGNAALSHQLCECCCENRLAIANQTNALQSQAAANHADSVLQRAQNFAAQQLQTAQNHAEDRLDVCQQTNAIERQADSNTRSITDAIAAQSIMINEKFCDLEKRELQNKINTQGDIITQLRGQLDNDRQTAQFYGMIAPLQAKVNEIAAKQPNTVPVQYPNLVAANATPYIGQGYGYGYGYPFGNGFGGGVVL